jgi:hypothetical protein
MANYEGVMSAHVTDAYGIEGTAPAFITMPDTATLAEIAADVASYIEAIDDMSQGWITKGTLTITLPGGTVITPQGDIEKGALFNFGNATDSYAQGQLVPDVNPAILNAQGLVNLANTDVTDFVTFMTTAHTAITVVTKGVRALSSLLDALITFRKHRKPLSRKTKEIA